MQKFDHPSIYLLIAGSYTPFCLVTLQLGRGAGRCSGSWGMAVIGMLQEIKPRSEARILSIVIYAVMVDRAGGGQAADCRARHGGLIWLATAV